VIKYLVLLSVSSILGFHAGAYPVELRRHFDLECRNLVNGKRKRFFSVASPVWPVDPHPLTLQLMYRHVRQRDRTI
jgi:hypothetical protein